MHNEEKLVSQRDALTLLEIIHDCLSCVTTSDASNVMRRVSTLIDFNHAIYALAQLDKQGAITQYEMINFSYPLEWLSLYQTKNFHLRDPIAMENLSNYNLQYWADTYEKYPVDKEFKDTSCDFNLFNGYAAGTTNQVRTEGCLLSMAGDMAKHPRHDYILNNLLPHLHVAFSNILQNNKKQKVSSQISRREKEVLDWIQYGKSTWDISVILKISERTVKYHANNIMTKLNAVNRSHAVAIAIRSGLIDFA